MSELSQLKGLSRERLSSEYNLSFAGCGFLCTYHIGVVSCIRRFAPELYINRMVSGASAGALIGAFLICDVDQSACTKCLMDIINRSREYFLGAFDPRFDIMKYLKESVDRLLPQDAHIKCSGRLFISMTHKKSGSNLVVGHYNTRDDLIRALLCSSFIPVFGGLKAPEYKDNLPNMNRNTITVSPFCGDADICPRDDIWEPSQRAIVTGHVYISKTSVILNWTNLKRVVNVVVPMSYEGLARLACSGFEDALRFLLTRGLIACPIHRTSILYNDHQRSTSFAGELNSLTKRRGMTRVTSTMIFKRPNSLSPSPIKIASSSHMIKSASRNLLCELTNPLDKSFYHTTFGSRSLAAPDCVSCRAAVLDSYVSKLPINLFNAISGKESDNNSVKDHKPKAEVSLLWFFPRFSMNVLPEWLYPSSATHDILAEVLTLLAASVSLQISAVQAMISAFIGFIKRLPKSSASALEPVVNHLTSFDATLTTLIEEGTARTEKLANILRSNEGLYKTFNCLIDMIRSDLRALVQQPKPIIKSPLQHSWGFWFM